MMTDDISARPARQDVTAYLSLGSNLGDRLSYLRGALRYLERNDSIKLEAVSSVYETDPVGLTNQPIFLNIVLRISTSLLPRELLHYCQEAEKYFDRDHTVHWGPRTLDIDLLTYDEIMVSEPDLVLPHPSMSKRAFVQVPMDELETGKVGCTENVRPLYTHWYHIRP